jgi:hypothetical protein
MISSLNLNFFTILHQFCVNIFLLLWETTQKSPSQIPVYHVYSVSFMWIPRLLSCHIYIDKMEMYQKSYFWMAPSKVL